MTTDVTVALIGAAGAVVAAAIAVMVKRGKGEKASQGIRTGTINAGQNVVIAERDAVLIQSQDSRFISKEGGSLIIAVSKEVIRDEALRQSWSSFDAEFLMKCLKDSPRGMTFDGESFREFRKPENDKMFGLGVQVYTACCKRLKESHPDYTAFNRIAQSYLSARMVLRGAG